jgi:predicted transcriptional regulator
VEEENLVKKTCRELGITQKELAEKIGVKPESLNSSLSRGKISNQTKKSIEMLLEIERLSSNLKNYVVLEEAITNIVNHNVFLNKD